MKISQLSKAYEAFNMLKSIGMSPSQEQLAAIRNLESSYLDDEIIPLLKSELEPLFSQIRGKIKLDFRYSPDSGVFVKPFTERETNTSQRNYSEQEAHTGRGKMKYKIRVTFPDNSVSCKVPVLETLIDVVKYAKPERVQSLNMYIMGDNLVSPRLNPDARYRAAQKEVVPGLYVCTYSSTDTKYDQIRHINSALGLGLKIEKVII